jgi:hypothetical protein
MALSGVINPYLLIGMDKEIRWIKGKLYREECPGNWEPYDPDAPPDTERVQNIKKRRAELQTMLDHIRKATNDLQNSKD